MLKVALTSDLHLGITKEKSIRKILKKIAAEKPDLYLNCGDYNGGWHGWRPVRTISRLEKELLPEETRRAACLGNHDYWYRSDSTKANRGTGASNPGPVAWDLNYEKIKQAYAESDVHFFDEQGLLYVKDWVFAGHTGWYGRLELVTNDCHYIPHGYEGDTHKYMQKRAYQGVCDQLDRLLPAEKKRAFVSHFPVMMYGWEHGHGGSPSLGRNLSEEWGFTKFFNGHMHARHEGPSRYEAGSDYGEPNYLIVELP